MVLLEWLERLMQPELQLPQEARVEVEPGEKQQGSQEGWNEEGHSGLDGPLKAMWSEWLMAQKGKLGLERKGDLLEIPQLLSVWNWGSRQGFLPPISE